MFHKEEYDAGKINNDKEDGQIGDEQIGDFTSGDPTDY